MRPLSSFVGQPIRSLQTMLRVIAEDDPTHLRIVPDGIYGPETTAAVSTFQRKHGLPVTGVTDQATWEAVVGVYTLVRIDAAQPVDVILNPGQVIRRGESNPHLYLAQAMLTVLADIYKSVAEPTHSGILDEPTVGLDPKQIIEIRDLIKELGKNHTVILSSHILSEISAVCDHIFIISKGKLVAGDSTENLMKQMSGAQEIELLIKGDNAAVQETFTGIAEVEKCIPLEQKDEACVHLNLIAKPGMDIREQVFASCVNHGFVILQMNPVSKSLEDVFLELTEKEGTQKEVLPEKKLHFVKSHFGKESKE